MIVKILLHGDLKNHCFLTADYIKFEISMIGIYASVWFQNVISVEPN